MDFIYAGCPIFKWVAMAWLEKGQQDCSSSNGHQGDMPYLLVVTVEPLWKGQESCKIWSISMHHSLQIMFILPLMTGSTVLPVPNYTQLILLILKWLGPRDAYMHW